MPHNSLFNGLLLGIKTVLSSPTLNIELKHSGGVGDWGFVSLCLYCSYSSNLPNKHLAFPMSAISLCDCKDFTCCMQVLNSDNYYYISELASCEA